MSNKFRTGSRREWRLYRLSRDSINRLPRSGRTILNESIHDPFNQLKLRQFALNSATGTGHSGLRARIGSSRIFCAWIACGRSTNITRWSPCRHSGIRHRSSGTTLSTCCTRVGGILCRYADGSWNVRPCHRSDSATLIIRSGRFEEHQGDRVNGEVVPLSLLN